VLLAFIISSTTQKTAIFIPTAVRTSNPTEIYLIQTTPNTVIFYVLSSLKKVAVEIKNVISKEINGHRLWQKYGVSLTRCTVHFTGILHNEKK
jgi:hypothetical protein